MSTKNKAQRLRSGKRLNITKVLIEGVAHDVRTRRMPAAYVETITVEDPVSRLPVEVAIYREQAGGMFGVDVSYIEQEAGPIISPFNNGVIYLGE